MDPNSISYYSVIPVHRPAQFVSAFYQYLPCGLGLVLLKGVGSGGSLGKSMGLEYRLPKYFSGLSQRGGFYPGTGVSQQGQYLVLKRWPYMEVSRQIVDSFG